MKPLPREARDGLMRAWLEILREQQPGVSWVPAQDAEATTTEATDAAVKMLAT